MKTTWEKKNVQGHVNTGLFKSETDTHKHTHKQGHVCTRPLFGCTWSIKEQDRWD